MVPAGETALQSAAATSRIEVPEPPAFVGRTAELANLARTFDQARAGRRQLVFVTGEPGIGKSSLADTFLQQLRGVHAARTTHGQCLDHHGVGEPYLPLIEALTRLACAPDGAAVMKILVAQQLARADAVAVDTLGAPPPENARPRDARAYAARADARSGGCGG